MKQIESQSLMALIVYSIGSYQQGFEHFKENHLDSALENYSLMKDYILSNEKYMEEKENFKRDGSEKTPLVNAQRRFKKARKKLLDFVVEQNRKL